MITLLLVISATTHHHPTSSPPYSGLGQQWIKQKLKYKNKTNLLLHYSDLFSDPNFGVLYIVIVLQYVPKFHQNPLPKHFIYSVSQSLCFSTSPIIKIVTGINNTQCKHLWKQFY